MYVCQANSDSLQQLFFKKVYLLHEDGKSHFQLLGSGDLDFSIHGDMDCASIIILELLAGIQYSCTMYIIILNLIKKSILNEIRHILRVVQCT